MRWYLAGSLASLELAASSVDRVPLLKGRLSENASTATSYSWFVWDT